MAALAVGLLLSTQRPVQIAQEVPQTVKCGSGSEVERGLRLRIYRALPIVSMGLLNEASWTGLVRWESVLTCGEPPLSRSLACSKPQQLPDM